MKKVMVGLAILVLVGCMAASPTISSRAPSVQELSSLPEQYRELQGTWTVYRARVGRLAMPDKTGVKMHFEDNRFWFEGDSGFEVFDINAESDPKRIDFWDETSAVQGIYLIKGDTLIVCSSPPGSSRPSDFDPPAFSKQILTEAKTSP